MESDLESNSEQVLGVDIGGSGIKAAPVDIRRGELTAERLRINTPTDATPAAVASVVAELVEAFGWKGPVGCGIPGPVRHGVVREAVNLHSSWSNVDAEELIRSHTDNDVTMINDADAAGLAEATFGSARDQVGLTIVLTLGTGIGSAMIIDGTLVPNTELGHLEMSGSEAEHLAAARVRKAENLSWADWGDRVADYLQHLERLFWPDRFIIGGGVSRKLEKFADSLARVSTPIAPASMLNTAGIVGAALAAATSK